MPTAAAHHTHRAGRRGWIARWGAVVVAGTLGVACSSTRDAGSTSTVRSEPAGSTSSPAGGSADGAGSTTAAPTTVAPTTIAETTTTVEPTTTTTSPPTTTTAPLVTAGAKVIVANATNVPGGAGRLANELSKVGYTVGDPTNAAGNEEFLDATKVYFLPDGEAVATGLATVLGVPLARMPTPAPITDATAGLGDATVLVMLGKDLAGKTPPGLKGR